MEKLNLVRTAGEQLLMKISMMKMLKEPQKLLPNMFVTILDLIKKS